MTNELETKLDLIEDVLTDGIAWAEDARRNAWTTEGRRSIQAVRGILICAADELKRARDAESGRTVNDGSPIACLTRDLLNA